MDFRIADTFTDSLGRLTGDEQKAVKMTAFDLQMNPAHPAMQFHKLDRAKDKHFWSVRVSSDIRLIVHRTDASLLLCYVDHHDEAYRWAERRKLETHPKTGAAQWVEVRERVEEIVVPHYVDAPVTQQPSSAPLLFAHQSDEDLLGYGVPAEWLDEVRQATERNVLDLIDHLPREAAEALLDLATGTVPQVPIVKPVGADPFEHPDAKRRFRSVKNVEELTRALDAPWEKWAVFLHPAQQQSVERHYNGPARISGAAGTGKTIVALHRAVFLARSDPDSRVLLTTFSDPLANALKTKLKQLVGNEPRIGERLDVFALDRIARTLYKRNFGPPKLASPDMISSWLEELGEGSPFSVRFLLAEWHEIVDPWQVTTWDAYREVPRLGRKTRLQEKQRAHLWTIFGSLRTRLRDEGLITVAEMYSRLAIHFTTIRSPYDFIVVDEAQDLGVAQLRLLAAMSQGQPDSLFFAGDLGQRIFQPPFSWKALGVDVRGRSRTLRINYRTSHQIRAQADRLLGPELSDVDGNLEDRRGATSVFNGPPPTIQTLPTQDEEAATVTNWLRDRVAEGINPHEIGVFVRSDAELNRARSAVSGAGLPLKVLDDQVDVVGDHVSICTMHLAKGLEFRAVVVMACDDEVIPSQSRIETVSDTGEIEDVYNTERHLLYVACTRARDHLLVTSTEPSSEFLDDLKAY